MERQVRRSQALGHWRGERGWQLDEVERAHAALGGAGPGRRWRTQRINHAYAVLLASHFQGFSRELHAEVVRFFASRLAAESHEVFDAVSYSFGVGLRLNTGNARADGLQNDFKRFGVDLWAELLALNSGNRVRRDKLEELNAWRNAIAHQDFTRVRGEQLPLGRVRAWRTACGALARDTDKVVCAHLHGLFGLQPW